MSTCPTCGHVSEAIPPPPVLQRQAAGDVEPEPEPVDDTFNDAYAAMTIKLPPSERAKLCARLAKKGLNPFEDTPEGLELVETAFAAYQKRLERSRAGSAKRRAAAKATASVTGPATEPEPEPEPAKAEPEQTTVTP